MKVPEQNSPKGTTRICGPGIDLMNIPDEIFFDQFASSDIGQISLRIQQAYVCLSIDKNNLGF
jgi:hypothetical protein